MTKKVSSAEAKAKFSELVAEAGLGGKHIVIERRGKPQAAIVSMEDLKRIETGHAASSHPRGALALVGVWKDMPDKVMDRLVKDVYESRAKDLGRRVDMEV